MLRLFGYILLLGFLTLTWAARPAASSKKAAKKSATSRTAAKKSGARSASKNTSKSGSKSGRRVSASRTSGRKTASWRSRQGQPTPERYRQIQEALAAKGYLKSEDATGQWGPDSVEALKRFQDDQKIAGAGKINSLSLIALGLGPKRENLAATKPPATPPPGQ